MTNFFIRLRIGAETYDCVTEATSIPDVCKQVEAMQAGLRLVGGSAEVALVEVSSERTRGREYSVLGKWIRA